MKVLRQYINGGYKVTLYEDGTKIRIGEGKPVLPESIDLKITNYCDAGCAYCHENSTTEGLHASLENIFNVINQMIEGSELAIGGGNPLSHPNLIEILEYAKNKGVICNLTVNGFHIKRYEKLIRDLRKDKMIYGLGLSYSKRFEEDIKKIIDNNTVIHFILGIHRAKDMIFKGKILLLGYKTWGRGKQKKIAEYAKKNIQTIKYALPFITRCNELTCFDNLAIDQLELNVKDREEYMGDEGSHTMYIDAVKNEYGINSFSDERRGFANLNQAFKTL